MPGGDRTGPLGFGSMSGRSAGYCAGYAFPGFANPVGSRAGMGYRRGFGRRAGGGFRRGFSAGYPAYPPMSSFYPSYGTNYPYQGALDPKQEMDILIAEADDIKAELDAVNKRIAELKKDKES